MTRTDGDILFTSAEHPDRKLGPTTRGAMMTRTSEFPVQVATLPWRVALMTRSRARDAAAGAGPSRPIEDVVRPGLEGIVNDTRQSIALARRTYANSDRVARLMGSLEQFCDMARRPRVVPVKLAPPPSIFSGPGVRRQARLNAEAYARGRLLEQRRAEITSDATAALRTLTSMAWEHLALEERQIAIAHARVELFEETFWTYLTRPVVAGRVDFLSLVRDELPIPALPRYDELDEITMANARAALGLAPHISTQPSGLPAVTPTPDQHRRPA
jgi:hypothetical protein